MKRPMVTVVLVALAAATLLDSENALAAAQQVRYAAVRAPLVSVLRPVNHVALSLGLDAPRDGIARAFGNTPMGSSDEDPHGLAARARALATQQARPSAPPSTAAPRQIPYVVDGLAVPTALPKPDPGRPLRVLVTGDSTAGEPGYALADLLGETGRTDLDVRDEPYTGTGLTRPDAFDWSRKAASQAASYAPDVVVVFLGENDGFPLDGASPYGETWRELYGARIQAVINAYQAGGVKLVLWAAPPIDAQTSVVQGSNVNVIYRNIEAATRDAVNRIPGTAMINQYDLFSVNGRFSHPVPDPTTGAVVPDARLADGSHLTRSGGMIVARLVVRYLDLQRSDQSRQAEAAARHRAGHAQAPAPDSGSAGERGQDGAGRPVAQQSGPGSNRPVTALVLGLFGAILAVCYLRAITGALADRLRAASPPGTTPPGTTPRRAADPFRAGAPLDAASRGAPAGPAPRTGRAVDGAPRGAPIDAAASMSPPADGPDPAATAPIDWSSRPPPLP